MKYYIIAGEASGDLHGSNLIKELHKLDANAVFRCWGGDQMETAGATLVKHFRDLAFMGFTEVLKNLLTIFRNLSFCKKDISTFRPDVLILIDYPGFNLRIAKWAKQQGFRIVYYISPQVWAWKESRIRTIRKCIDLMLVILPFEKEFYQKWNYQVEYVGHPLVEVIDNFRSNNPAAAKLFLETHSPDGSPVIALLPGSRRQEILQKLPIMLEVTKHFPHYKFIVARAPGLQDEFYEMLMTPFTNVQAVINQTYDLLSASSAALVTSGTATLETALFGVPEIICYKGGNISYQIAKMLITIKFIGLVNLIMNKEVVKELIQDKLTVNNIRFELNKLLTDEDKKQQIKEDYITLKKLLLQGGNASANAARKIDAFIKG